MSELINTHDNRATIRWKLLTGASALALAAYVSSGDIAKAEDASRPLIWLELDGQFATQKNDLEVYSPPFFANSPFDGVSSLAYEKTRPYIWDKSGKISFQPQGSDWVVSASIRYGKSGRAEKSLYITPNPVVEFYGQEKVYRAYQDSELRSSESHTIIDFHGRQGCRARPLRQQRQFNRQSRRAICAIPFEQSRRLPVSTDEPCNHLRL